MQIREVFLSHSHHDRAFVSPLVDTLRRHGIPLWYSGTDIIPAQQWHDEIGAALDRCDWFMIVLSANAMNSIWMRRELHYALQQDRLADKIIPLLYQNCDYGKLSWTLSSYQMVDFRTGFEDGCRDLLRVWGLGFKP